MRTTRESQQALDLEIAKLEQDLVILRRRRNSLSPISQLPTELIFRIFYLSIHCPETERKVLISIRLEGTRRSITHVSHGWRTVALEWPKLWSEIHIRDRTNVEHLDLARKRAKDLPLSIAFCGDRVYGTPGVFHIFQVETERLTSVVLSAPIEVLRSLLPKIKACSNTIQFLRLEVPHSGRWTPVDLTQIDSFYNFPRLQRLEIQNWNTLFIPPALFNPTSLTMLKLAFFCLPAARVIHAVFASLRNVVQHLTSLSLTIILPPHLEDVSLDITGTPPINMPALEDIAFISNGARVLSELSSVLCVPSSIRTVRILAQQGASSQDVSLALHHACTNIASPRFLQIDNEFDPGDGTHKMDVRGLKNPPLTAHSNAHMSEKPDLPLIPVGSRSHASRPIFYSNESRNRWKTGRSAGDRCCQPLPNLGRLRLTALPTGRSDGNRPATERPLECRVGFFRHNAVTLSFIAGPYAGRHPPEVQPYTFPVPLINPANWLFSALHHILVTCQFPVPFWKALASVPTLRVIEYQVTNFEDAFCRVLEEAVASGQVGAGDRTFYPSLNAIRITFEGKNVAWDVEYAERLALVLLHKHQGMGTPTFEWLDFKGCGTHVDADTLRLLFSVSKSVCWY
ncbi:hypothetical protein D9611_000630 [Ephemerocybe angulata]|uniref:F-box domain-containing protein n=1 Tax=Ephemerocybe angulata TaxID=980116 RepID=A0A8H5BNA9_9AGAR|nr:hypothetical protein D9611_000630 [Tulosesus angulatus]